MTEQLNNPLHGITLKDIVTELVERLGWQELARRVNINCFKSDPSIKSSLTFLRRTPWARAEVEALYVEIITGPWGKANNKTKS
ncbi:VF530 family DNA-binding protein [Oceanisphaera sp. W20_SRM_FM3]|uniref:VF530 family protein n=1 Tax=Oceanisphaera sp. W20_SRM_FM3 TaxID=3240267 RepID=UPI003F98D0D6